MKNARLETEISGMTDATFIKQARAHNRRAMMNTATGQWLADALRRLSAATLHDVRTVNPHVQPAPTPQKAVVNR